MKIFLDTASREVIKKWSVTGLIDGVTTNPSLLVKEDGEPKKVLTDICAMISGPVSFEVVEKDPDAVYKQAREIAACAPNVVVKIPCLQEYLPVIHRLSCEGIALNITLVFTALQALMMAKLGVAYISPFVGRWDDLGHEGVALLQELVTIKKHYGFSTQILAASLRSPLHWKQAALVGVDVVTIPPAVIEQGIKHPLTDKGVALFDADWKKAGRTQLL
ncbi:MAG: putative transaldolase [candidate division TM6 bacterium GW2011_GWF2_38_10]|nr:MAG: putative transaldolase [candidate division TM6 bacterium GW2011_GWF2_38_10]